jgi:hypothetical protein
MEDRLKELKPQRSKLKTKITTLKKQVTSAIGRSDQTELSDSKHRLISLYIDFSETHYGVL